MQTIISNDFLKADYYLETKYLYIYWKKNTDSMTIDEYKNIFLDIKDFFSKNQVQNWLGNLKDFGFVVFPELQAWIVEEINPTFRQAGLQKMAIVVPTEFFSEISISQAVDDINESNQQQKEVFEIQYFAEEEEGKKWLFGNK